MMHGRLPLAFMLGIGEWQSGHCTASIFLLAGRSFHGPATFVLGGGPFLEEKKRGRR
jgi:hypothetical protein